MLTSTKNPQIIRIRKLQNNIRTRKEEGLFVIEGVRLMEEALNSGWKPVTLIHTEDLNQRGMDVVQAYASLGIKGQLVARHVMQAASDTQNPQGILALLPFPDATIPEKLEFTLILNNLRDPGNMGTILRTALAAGVDCIFIPPGTVDPFSPKVVRAGMGAHFKLPLLNLSWSEIRELVKARSFSCYLADTRNGNTYDQIEYISPLLFIIGGEATGVDANALTLSPKLVHIPMRNSVESLNAAIATSILIFEVSRQRRIRETEST